MLIQEQKQQDIIEHLYNKANECIDYDRIEDAIMLHQEIINRNKDYFKSYFELGLLYELNNNTEKAINIYRKGIEISKTINDNKAYNELSIIMLSLLEVI